MKFLFAFVLSLSFLFTGCFQPQSQPSIQRKSAHMILYKNKRHEDTAVCSGTAVGRHAILTASHCDYGDVRTISLDLSTHEYQIKRAYMDGRDHTIYIIDGPAFQDISVIHQRAAKDGEYAYFYGDGDGEYPPVFKSGVVEPNQDISEVDRKSGLQYYTITSIPGDSGSAIYASDGSIIGLVTYGMTHKTLGFEQGSTASGFELNFSPEVLAAIAK